MTTNWPSPHPHSKYSECTRPLRNLCQTDRQALYQGSITVLKGQGGIKTLMRISKGSSQNTWRFVPTLFTFWYLLGSPRPEKLCSLHPQLTQLGVLLCLPSTQPSMCCKLWLTYIMGTCIFCLGLLVFFNQSLSLLTILPLPITILTASTIICVLHIRGFPGCSVVKNLSVKQEMGFDPWVGKILWRRKCNSLQYSCLENPIDREACGLQSKGSQRVRQDFMTKLPLTIRCKT